MIARRNFLSAALGGLASLALLRATTVERLVAPVKVLPSLQEWINYEYVTYLEANQGEITEMVISRLRHEGNLLLPGDLVTWCSTTWQVRRTDDRGIQLRRVT